MKRCLIGALLVVHAIASFADDYPTVARLLITRDHPGPLRIGY